MAAKAMLTSAATALGSSLPRVATCALSTSNKAASAGRTLIPHSSRLLGSSRRITSSYGSIIPAITTNQSFMEPKRLFTTTAAARQAPCRFHHQQAANGSGAAMTGAPLVGSKAPAFESMAVLPDGAMKKISLSDYDGQFVVILFYPLDWSFVCPSELIAFDRAASAFRQRNVQVIACSIDSHYCHGAWRKASSSEGGIGDVGFPILSDVTKEIAHDYGVLHTNGLAMRGLFILNKDHKICHATINDFPIGRSVEEVLRTVDAIQHFDANGEVCPANWQKGKDAVVPTAAGIAKYLRDNVGNDV